jgi:hypothetical protein
MCVCADDQHKALRIRVIKCADMQMCVCADDQHKASRIQVIKCAYVQMISKKLRVSGLLII